MDATLILIDSDAELARARALVDRLWNSDDPADVARLAAQAVHAANPTPEPAMALVKFLADPANARHWKDGGFEPAEGRQKRNLH